MRDGKVFKNEKKVSVANFNVVFMTENEERPLLDFFDIILMPALKSGITRHQGNNTYLLMDIEVKTDEYDDYVLTGLIVKSTILEVKSMFDEYGNLVERDDVYPTAPFSTFVIYLKNHRMILVENQKGSPSLDNFRSTVKYMLDTYIARENHRRVECNEEQLPIPLVSIVGIPPKGGMIAALKKVEKISTLTLRFYPLNGDGDLELSGIMSGVTKELRRKIGSDRGSLTYRSPKNINGVIEIVEAAEGTLEPIVVAKYPGRKGDSTIKYSEVSDRRKMYIPEGERNNELANMIKQGKEIDSINYTSEENDKIYLRNQKKIIPFIRNKK
ncbi:MAG: hypothetical protein HFG53_12125 [Lachnospiraceae bacterium]|jgi:hypothetical protein|nr:hypothetical protein [Lachnospiraceae bacterium]